MSRSVSSWKILGVELLVFWFLLMYRFREAFIRICEYKAGIFGARNI